MSQTVKEFLLTLSRQEILKLTQEGYLRVLALGPTPGKATYALTPDGAEWWKSRSKGSA